MVNKTNEAKEHVIPLMEELKKQCLLNGIPCFVSVAVGDFLDPKTNEPMTKYVSEIVSPAVVETKLVDDRITKMLNVINGFDTVDPNLKFEVDF